jgi:glycine hydroxymethyltransferase
MINKAANNMKKFKDTEIDNLINQEFKRQSQTINLIASENYPHPAVLQAQANILSSKYAEGYTKKRYYGGCQIIDSIEDTANVRLQKIFKAEYSNVQPHSGSQANMASYFALLQPGDTVLAMSLNEGGHLTHGHAANFSGALYNFIHYGVDPHTNLLNYAELQEKALRHKPKLIIAGASAYARIIDFAKIKQIADQVNAYFLVDMAHIAGLVAAGLHPSPVGLADIITSTTHKTLRGPRGGIIIAKTSWAEKINKALMPGIQGGPMMNIIAAKAVAFELALKPEFYEYQKQVIKNAQHLASCLAQLGYDILTGGTDNHLILIDLRNKNITGRAAEKLLESVGIVVNRNSIPNDPQKPLITSGLRLGTPALTTRGMVETDFTIIAELIDQALTQKSIKVKSKIKELTKKFPIWK